MCWPSYRYIIILLLCSAGIITAVWHHFFERAPHSSHPFDQLDKRAFKMPRAMREAARFDYFFEMLRDPETNSIPPNIRLRELTHYRELKVQKSKSRSFSGPYFDWLEAGPYNVGGRTNALESDRRNPDIILAGSASGGVWRSTDGGSTWALTSDPAAHLSVMGLAQDPTTPDTWYFSSGELRSTNNDRGKKALYYGSGLFKSTDNGASWEFFSYSSEDDQLFIRDEEANPALAVEWNSPFNYTWNLKVDDNGTVWLATARFGILRSQDGGEQFERVLPQNQHEPTYSDINITTDGRLIAAISTNFVENREQGTGGIYASTDGGDQWEKLTINDLPESHRRTVLAPVPSNPNLLYLLTHRGGEQIYLIRYHLGTGTSANLTDKLPAFGSPVGINSTQADYNMLLQVKPDNPQVVLVGLLNLYRTMDGFSSTPTPLQKDRYWIGGYTNNNQYALYPGHHPDLHGGFFQHPDIYWSAHDGGISRTANILADSVGWQLMNAGADLKKGFNVTQFYSVTMPRQAGNYALVGGTQDNGSPYFTYHPTLQRPAQDISFGDGGYTFWGDNYVFTSIQRGFVWRLTIDQENARVTSAAAVHPEGATSKLFIHPFAVDPANDHILYYPSGRKLFRNTRLDQIPVGNTQATSIGWELSDNLCPAGYTMSAIEAVGDTAHTIYFAAYNSLKAPKIFKIVNADTSFTAMELALPNVPAGAYPHDIATSSDGKEVVLVLSNYNIDGLYYSNDYGNTFQSVEGNLLGTAELPGPSLRNAAVIQAGNNTLYVVGTSTGVYATHLLEGENTRWIPESESMMGSAIAEYVFGRDADTLVAAATHGRGIFLGSARIPRVTVPFLFSPDSISGNGFAIRCSDVGATRYRFEVKLTDDDEVTVFTRFEPRLRLKNLQSNTRYSVRVLALDDNGFASAYSNEQLTVTLLQRPEITDVLANDHQITAKWDSIPEALEYIIQLSSSSGFEQTLQVNTGLRREHVFSQLDEGSVYYLRVKALGQPVSSEFSETITARTQITGDPPDGNYRFRAVPNPFVKHLEIQTPYVITSPVSCWAYDSKGRLVFQYTDLLNGLNEKLALSSRQWNRGLYVLVLQGAAGAQSLRIIKK